MDGRTLGMMVQKVEEGSINSGPLSSQDMQEHGKNWLHYFLYSNNKGVDVIDSAYDVLIMRSSKAIDGTNYKNMIVDTEFCAKSITAFL